MTRFAERVEAILGDTRAGKSLWGILVADRDSGQTLYSLNGDHFFAPASNAKLFTTALALATLGREFRFRTTLESKSPLGSDGHLAGDLILVGRGDPEISNRKFPFTGRVEREGPAEKILVEMADSAVATGLREVEGDIVADDSYFPYDPYPAGWGVGDIFFEFGAPVSAIAFNDNIISIEVQPGTRVGDPARIATIPSGAQDTFGHEVMTASAGGPSDLAVVRQPGLNFLLLRGTIAVGHAPMRLDLAMTEPAETAALTLKALLEARGVRVGGGTRVEHAPPPGTTAAGEPVIRPSLQVTSDAQPVVLAEHFSPPLLESVRLTNKISQNLHAEEFLRAVGREKLTVGSTAAGLKAERDFLQTAGIISGDVMLSDGSGLSPNNLVTPRGTVTLLRYAWQQPWGRDFLSTLPVAGMDGTLENRMKNSAASGMIEAKTGTTEHVRALSGYATTLRGENLAFAIFCNNNPQHGAEASAPLDAIATAMVEMLGSSTPAKSRK